MLHSKSISPEESSVLCNTYLYYLHCCCSDKRPWFSVISTMVEMLQSLKPVATLFVVWRKGSKQADALLPFPSLSVFIQARTQAQRMICVTFKGLPQTSITVTKTIPHTEGQKANTILVIPPRFARGLSY